MKCLLSVQDSEIFFFLFYTAHLVLLYFIFFQRRISFLCTKNLTHPVKLSFYHKQSIACNHTPSGGKLLPEACADMQLSSSMGRQSRLGEWASKPGQLTEWREDVKREFTKLLEMNVSIKNDVPEILISWAILEQKISSCLCSIFSCGSSIRKGYRQVKMRFLITELRTAADGPASSISKMLLR